MDIFSDLVSNLGYPGAFCAVMIWFLKYTFDNNTVLTNQIIEIIENNTKAITAMKEEIKHVRAYGSTVEDGCNEVADKI